MGENTLEASLILTDQSFTAGVTRAREAAVGLVKPVKDAAGGTAELGKASKDAAGGVDKLGQSAKDTAGGGVKQLIDGLKAVAGAAIVQKVVGTTIELGKLGVQAKATGDKFEALAGSAANAEQYLLKIRTGTDYTIDKMTAMQSVSKLLSMGLTDNAASAAEFVVMATRLGDSTQATSNRISDFAALLANQSIPRLDNYGISSGRVRQRIEELQAANAGLSREAAFTQAVLEEGRLSLERLGDAGTGQVQAVERLEAAWADLRVEMGERAAPAMAGLAEKAAAILTYHERLADAFNQNAEAALAAGKSWEEYAAQQYKVRLEMGWYSQIASMVDEQLIAEGASVEEMSAVLGDNNRLIEYAVAHGLGFNETLDRTAYTARQTAVAVGEIANKYQLYGTTIAAQYAAQSGQYALTQKQREELVQLAAAQARVADARLADAQGIATSNQSYAQLPGLYAQLTTLEGQLTTTTGGRAAAVGKAAEAQIKERDAILEKIKAIEQEAAQQLAQQAVASLKAEDFQNAADYTKAKQELMLATGLVTEEALAEQEAIGLLTREYADGKIDAGDYALTLGDVKDAAADGQVSLEELLAPLRDARDEMAKADGKADALSGGLGSVGDSASGATGKVGGFAGALGTTGEKLQALVKGSPWKISVVAQETGGGGGGAETPERPVGTGVPELRAAGMASGRDVSITGGLGAIAASVGAVGRPANSRAVSVTFAPTVVVGNRVDENKLLWRMRTELGRFVRHYAGVG